MVRAADREAVAVVVLGGAPNLYHDDGCGIAPACLSCPLDVCRYDGPDVAARLRSERNRAIAQAVVAGGMGVGVAAARFGVSRWTVERAVAAATAAAGGERGGEGVAALGA